jgi:hypothetical protein
MIEAKDIRMKKLILTIATVTALAAAASAPAEARTLRPHLHPAAAAAVAAAAAIAADAYLSGPYGTYVGPAPVYYGAPVYLGYGYRY